MFTVGSTYVISTWDGGEDGMTTDHLGCKVLEFSAPLLKVTQAGSEWIINTASPAFAGARPDIRYKAEVTEGDGRYSISLTEVAPD